MQSEAKRKSQKSRLGRAHSRIAELDWMDGYPLEGSWRTVAAAGPSTPIRIDRSLLIDAERSVSILRNRHGCRLGQVLDHPDHWLAGAEALIGELKAHVHRNEPLRRSATHLLGLGSFTIEMDRTLQRDSELVDLIDALSWRHVRTPQRYRAVLEVVRAHRRLLRNASVDHGLAVVDMVLAEARPRPGLLEVIRQHPSSHAADNQRDQLVDLRDTLLEIANHDERPNRFQRFELRNPELPTESSDIERLAAANRPDRRFVLDLMGAPIAVGKKAPLRIAEYRSLVTAGDCLIEQMDRSSGPEVPIELRVRGYDLGTSVAETLRNRVTGPYRPRWKVAWKLLDLTATQRATLIRIIDRIEDPDIVTKVLSTCSKADQDLRGRWLATLDRFVRLHGPRGVGPMLRVDGQFLGALGLLDPAEWAEAAAALAKLKDTESFAVLVKLWHVLGDRSEAERYFSALPRVYRWTFRSWDVERYAAINELCDSPKSFAALAVVVADHPRLVVDTLVQSLVAVGLGVDDLRGVLATPIKADVLYRFTSAGSPAVHCEESPSPPIWTARYDGAFSDQLRRLDTLSPSAEAIAEKLLGPTFPDPAELDTQIRALRSLTKRTDAGDPAHNGRAKRLAELERRRNRTPSHSEIGSLQRKLDRRIRSEAARFWCEEVDNACRHMTAVRLGPDHEWLNTLLPDETMRALSNLDPVYRDLAIRMLRQDAESGAALGFLDHPANAEFIAKATSKGIDLTPWINGVGSRTVDSDQGPVTLSIETDATTILQMGRPFDTCLSPGGFNFWSTVVNAVDVNKTVLVGRDLQGRMVARCLFALNERSEVLMYHPYRHGEWDFRQAALNYATAMTRAMGTSSAVQGRVSPVVSKDWYDDGPVDPIHDGLFRKGGGLVEELTALGDSEAIDLMVGRGYRPERVVPRLLRDSLLAGHVGLRRLLLHWLGPVRCDNVHDWTTVADTAVALEEFELAAALVRVGLERIRREQYGVQPRTIELVAMFQPSVALRLLRANRPRGVRRDADETSTVRIEAIACALERLNRPQAAKRMREVNPDRRVDWSNYPYSRTERS